MTKKILAAAIAVACAVALTAGPAHAGDGDGDGGRTTIVFGLEPDLAGPTSCPASLFGFALRIASAQRSRSTSPAAH